MASSSTFNSKRSPEPLTEGGAKRLCNRAEPPSLIDDVSETSTSQVISYEVFKCLGYSAQKQYFDEMCEALRDLKSFTKSCPRIDKKVPRYYDKDNRLSSVEQEAADILQEDLKKKWSLSKRPSVDPVSGHARPNMSEQTRWYDDKLQWNPANSKFEFELAQDRQRRHRCIPDDIDKLLRQYGFFYHISSSLLWYRLTIFTGELKSVATDYYKSSWDMTFYHIDGISTLRLWDSKGGARAVFDGLKRSQDDALEFVNFLTRFKFPHTYDGVIAGTVA